MNFEDFLSESILNEALEPVFTNPSHLKTSNQKYRYHDTKAEQHFKIAEKKQAAGDKEGYKAHKKVSDLHHAEFKKHQ